MRLGELIRFQYFAFTCITAIESAADAYDGAAANC